MPTLTNFSDEAIFQTSPLTDRDIDWFKQGRLFGFYEPFFQQLIQAVRSTEYPSYGISDGQSNGDLLFAMPSTSVSLLPLGVLPLKSAIGS